MIIELNQNNKFIPEEMGKLFYILFFVSFLFYSCKDSTNVIKYDDLPIEDEIPPEDEIQLNSALRVKVDPRIELLSVVQHFTTWAQDRHTKYESRYKIEVQKYFNQYSNHSAIKLSQELTDAGFSFDAPPRFVLYHNNPPEFKQIVAYSDYLIGRAGSKEKLESFADELRKFSEETNFLSFMESQKYYFIKIENDIKKTIGDHDYIKIIEDYYGEKQKSYNIIPASLFHAGGYGVSIQSDSGNDIYDICGPLGSTQGIPNFGDESNFQNILLHEFSHSFVNPVTEMYQDEVNSCAKLFEPIREKMQSMNYGNWEACVNEHLVRANVARFFNQFQGSEKKDDILKSEYSKGFIYIYGLDSLMQNYESDRIKYPTYTGFYPEILKYFEGMNK